MAAFLFASVSLSSAFRLSSCFFSKASAWDIASERSFVFSSSDMNEKKKVREAGS